MNKAKWAAIIAAIIAAFIGVIFNVMRDEGVDAPHVIWPSPTPTVVAVSPVPTVVVPTPASTAKPTPKPTATPVISKPAGSLPYTLVTKNMDGIANGWFRSKNLYVDNSAVVQARLQTPIGHNEAVRFRFMRRTNVVPDGTRNLKDVRNYPSASVGYTNDYFGRSVGSGKHSVVIETGTPDGSKSDGKVLYQSKNPKGWNIAYFEMPASRNKEQLVEIEYWYNSAYGKGDGRIKITVDGVVKFDEGGAILNAPRRDFSAQMVNANPGSIGRLSTDAYFEAKILGIERIK